MSLFESLNGLGNQSEALQYITENPVYQQYFSDVNPGLFLAQFMYESPSLCYNCKNSLGFYGLGVNQQEIDQTYQEGIIPNNEPTLKNEIYTAFDRYQHYLNNQCQGITDPLEKVKCVMNTYNGNSNYFNNVLKKYHQIAGLPIIDNNPSPLSNFSTDTVNFLSSPVQTTKNFVENKASELLQVVGIPIAFVILALLLLALATIIYTKQPSQVLILGKGAGKL